MKALVLIQKLLGTSVVTKSLVGLLIALVLGEVISTAVLVAIDRQHVLVAMGGETIVLALLK